MVAAITLGSALIGGVRGGLGARGRFVAVAWSLVAENAVRCAAVGVLLAAGDRRVVAYGLCLVAGQLVIVLWPSALRFGTEGDATGGPHPFAFLAGASVSQLIGQVVLTGPPVLLALAGGSPGDVTTLFAALALFRAPYMLALGMVAQLTTWVTQAVVAGDLSALARMRVRLRLATLVTVALAAGGAACWARSCCTLVFGPDVTLGSFAMALVAAGCALAVANLVLMVSGLAQGRSSSVARCWLGSVLAAGIAYVALTGLPLEDTVIWSFLVAEAVAFALAVRRRGAGPRTRAGVSRRSGAGLGRGQEHRRPERQVAPAQHPLLGRGQPHEQPLDRIGHRGEPAVPVAGRALEPADAAARRRRTGTPRRRRTSPGRPRSPARSTEADEPRPGVAAVVAGLDVVVGPGPLVGRHRQQHPAAGRAAPGPARRWPAPRRSQCSTTSKARDHVEGLVRERQRRRRPADALAGREPAGEQVERDPCGGRPASSPRSGRRRCPRRGSRPGCPR